MSLSWEYLRGTGYRVEVGQMLPYEWQNDEGATLRTDAVVDHVNKTITCSAACFEELEKLKNE
jgi:hypothetical protein